MSSRRNISVSAHLPMQLTFLRVFLSVLFLIIFLVFVRAPFGPNAANIVGMAGLWILFALIELSDLFDGIVARKYGLISNAGKVLDPLADVFSRTSYIVCFLRVDILPAWVCALIIYRELIIIALRMLYALKNVPLAASKMGKMKTIIFTVAIGSGIAVYTLRTLDILHLLLSFIRVVPIVLFIVGICISYASLLQYILRAKTEKLFDG